MTMPHNPSNHWLTVNECSALYQRSPRTIRHWISIGTFSHFNAQVLQIRWGNHWHYYIRQTAPILPLVAK